LQPPDSFLSHDVGLEPVPQPCPPSSRSSGASSSPDRRRSWTSRGAS
jgi:hypothetical protein